MKKNSKALVTIFVCCVLGFFCFYVLPFLFSLAYALVDNPISKQFVGLQNFVAVFQNKYFRLGLRNTLLFMLAGIPLNLALSLAAALVVNRMKRFRNALCLVFLIPLVIPSATTAFFWTNLFAVNGPVNRLLGGSTNWLESPYGMLVILLIFLWKNIGFNMVLFISGLGDIPPEYYEVAQISGAKPWQAFTRITLVYLTPTFFLTFIMSFVNSFRVFKEIYIITGDVPPTGLYVMQHYLNSTFMTLNYQKMVSAVYILTIGIILLIGVVFKWENRVSRDIRRLSV